MSTILEGKIDNIGDNWVDVELGVTQLANGVEIKEMVTLVFDNNLHKSSVGKTIKITVE